MTANKFNCAYLDAQSRANLPVLPTLRFDFRPRDREPIHSLGKQGSSLTEMTTKMDNDEQCVESLDDLRELVAETLCEHEGLEPGAFRLFERLLFRRGQACGIQFCLAGPRAVRLTAFWEVEKRTVLFYDSTGERFRRTELTGSSLELLADEQAA